MDSSLIAGIKLTIDADTTATGFGSGNVSGNSLWNNKKGNEGANNDITVIVDNEIVLAPLTGTIVHGLQTVVNATTGRESVTFTLSDVFALNELRVELWSDGTHISTTTYNKGAANSAELTVNIVVKGESSSWTTEWYVAAPDGYNTTVDYIPDEIRVYVDGKQVDTKTVEPNIFLNDSELAEYYALSGVYKAATVTDNDGKVSYYGTLQGALDAAAAGTGNMTVDILDDINLAGITWKPVTVSGPGYPVVTVNGHGKTITNLSDMLFAGTWAGKSGLIINNLTIANSTIKNDVNDSKGTVGVGAFIGYPQASATITLDNCHLVDSHVEGGHWTGGLIGMAGGYNGNDGPVFMNLTIKNCSVTGSTITGKGSAGGIIGHGSCAAWTNVDIDNVTVKDNTITSTGSSTNKAGSIMGTIGAAGQPTTANGTTLTGGATVSATVSGNTVTSGGTTITTIYGRQGTGTGMLFVDGGSYDTYPLETGVAYAKPADGYVIVKNTNGLYTVEEADNAVARIGDVHYATLAEAFQAAQAGDTVTILAGNYTTSISVNKAITVVGETDDQGNNLVNISGGISITADGATVKNLTASNPSTTGYNQTLHISAKDVLVEGCVITDGNAMRYSTTTGTVTFKNSTITGSTYGIHFDGSAGGNIVIDNCVITGWTSFARTITNVSIKDTTFAKGNYNLLRFYQNAEVINTTFPAGMRIDSGSGGTGMSGISLDFKGCSVDGADFETVFPGSVIVASDITVDDKKLVRVAKIGNTYYETLEEALANVADWTTIKLVANATLDYNAREAYGRASTTDIIIDGQGFTLTLNQKDSDWSSIGMANPDGKLTLKNMTIEKTGYGDTSGAWNTHAIIFSCNVEMKDVIVNNGIAVQNGATLNNVTINEAGGYYGLWINGNGQSVTINGGAINATNGGRGIKIADQYIDAPASVTLTVDGMKFNTAKKAAVLVSSKAGAAITAANVDITNVAEDSVNFVWIDEDWAADYGKVTVTGGSKAQESVEKFTVTIMDGDEIAGYYETFVDALNAAKAGNTIVLLPGTFTGGLTINKSGITVMGTLDENGAYATFVQGTLKISGSDITVKNLSVFNGGGNGGSIFGGNILVEHCEVTGANGFRNCEANNGDVTIKDSVITGGTYGIHFGTGAGEGNVIIDGCKVTGWTSFGAAIEKVTITNTEFLNGNYNQLRLYQDAELTNVKFNPDMTIDFGQNNVRADFNGCSVTDGSALTDIIYLADIVDMGVQVYENDQLVVPAARIVNGNAFMTLAEAVAAAQNGDTIVLVANTTGSGVVINKDITIDFGTYTYTVNQTVGSAGTTTLGFQILKGNNVTLKNGTLAATTVVSGKPVKMLIQNYANLTLTDMVLDGTGSADMLYVLSNNSGNIVVNGATSITAPAGAVAFDVYDYSSAGYAVPSMSINTTGTITGKIEVSDTATLAISGGTFTAKLAEAWCAEGFVPTVNADGTYTVMPEVDAEAKIDGVYYTDFKKALKAAQAGDTIVLLQTAVIDIDLTIENVTIKAEGFNPAIRIVNDAKVIVNNVTIESSGYAFILGASDETSAGNLTINSGSFKAGITVASVTKGTLTINGGAFRVDAYENGQNFNFMLNCIDANYRDGSAKIVVIGGTFYNFNPADNAAEGAYTSFVPKEYHSMSNGNGSFTVSKHSLVDIPAIGATCTADGLTEGKKCSVCGEITEAQEIVKATGKHTEKVVTVDATCTANGFTYSYCTACNMMIKAPELLPMIAHNYVDGVCTVCQGVGEAVAAINGIKYTTLEKAIEAAKNGDIIELLSNVKISDRILVTKKITIDLNNKKLYIGSGTVFTVDAQGDLTLTNGTIDGFNQSNGTILNAGGKLTLNDGVSVNTELQVRNISVLHRGGTLVVNGGTYLNKVVINDTAEIHAGTFTGEITVTNDEDLTIYGGTFAQNVSTWCAEGLHSVDTDNDGMYVVEKHSYDHVVIVDPTCTAAGSATYTCVCGDSYTVAYGAAAGHSNVVAIPGKAPTCTETGLTTGSKCLTCGEILVKQEEIPALGRHTEEIIPAVAPTYNSTGLTAGVKCSVCGVTLVPQEIVPMLTAVAQVNGTNYDTLAAAFAAANPGDIITLLTDATGSGVVINKDITIDFAGHTYTFNEGVGSTGTESNGFQILTGNTVTLKNGTLNVAAAEAGKFYILVQNYADLTVTDMILDGTNLDKWSKTDGDSYTLSNNSGKVVVDGNTTIIANDDGALAYAFDACAYGSYPLPTVTVADSVKVIGNVEAPAKVGNVYYATFDQAYAAAKAGDTLVLLQTAVIDSDTTIENVTIVAEGFNPAIRIVKGATVIVNNVTIESSGYAFILGASDQSSAGNLTVESGNFMAVTTVASVTKGTLTINGGEFSAEPYQGSYAYVINCIDANYKNGTAKVVISGGRFRNFDPQSNAAEGANTNFVADGYYAKHNGDGTWTVLEQTEITVKVDDATKTYGNPDPAFTVNGKQETLPGLTVEFDRVAGENAGTYTINATVTADRQYKVKVVPGKLTIEKRNAMINLADIFYVKGNPKPESFLHDFNGILEEDVTLLKVDSVGIDFDSVIPHEYTVKVTISDNYKIIVNPGKVTVYEAAAKVDNTYYATFAEAYAVAKESNATITLLAPVVITEDTTLDLAGLTITSSGDAFVVENGATLTINGDGIVEAGTSGVGSWCAVWANGGHAIINGGTYSVGGDTSTTDTTHQNDVIYTKNGGTVVINGGMFKNDGTVWTLNENDSNRNTITVYGGTFENWDPMNNVSEGAGTSFVADGYRTIREGDNYVVTTRLLGDASGDGKIDTLDVIMILDYDVRAITDDELDLVAADFNGDGFVDLFDALDIIDYMAA